MNSRSSGSIDVQGSSSPIEVSDILSLPKDASIRLITSYKPVKVSLPKGTEVKAKLRSEYGKIQSDFPVYLNADDKKLSTLAGIPVEIETSQNIYLLEEWVNKYGKFNL